MAKTKRAGAGIFIMVLRWLTVSEFSGKGPPSHRPTLLCAKIRLCLGFGVEVANQEHVFAGPSQVLVSYSGTCYG